MSLFNQTFKIIAVILFTVPTAAYANAWSCSHGNDVREVHISYSTSSPVPCDVVYKKLTEGAEEQILWNAKNDDSYCDEKAEGLIRKLESSGWVCTETISNESDTTEDSMTQ